jgi:hypothetical protein
VIPQRLSAADHLAGCVLLNPELRGSLRPDEAALLAAQQPLDPDELKARVILETDNDPERLVCHFRECVRRMRMDAGLDKPAESSAMQRLMEARNRETVSMADVETTERNRAAESAYRRGYVQGYWEGSENERKYGAEKVDAFWNDVLSPWRYRDCSRLVLPPEITDKAGGAA